MVMNFFAVILWLTMAKNQQSKMISAVLFE